MTTFLDFAKHILTGALLMLFAYCLTYLMARAATAAYFRSKVDFMKDVANMVKEGAERHGA